MSYCAIGLGGCSECLLACDSLRTAPSPPPPPAVQEAVTVWQQGLDERMGLLGLKFDEYKGYVKRLRREVGELQAEAQEESESRLPLTHVRSRARACACVSVGGGGGGGACMRFRLDAAPGQPFYPPNPLPHTRATHAICRHQGCPHGGHVRGGHPDPAPAQADQLQRSRRGSSAGRGGAVRDGGTRWPGGREC